MCYSLTLLEPDTLQVRYAARFPDHWEFTPTYYVNAFSIPQYPILPDMDRSHFHPMYWGLIPSWVKTKEDAENLRKQTMNARSESIFKKPSFRSAIKNRRCLIPANGFFEWRSFHGHNYPYYIHLNDHIIFSIAGIWEAWKDPKTEQEILTFSVITCDANPLMEKIHNKKRRMPVILPKESEFDWLEEDLSDERIIAMLTPYPMEKMQAYTISKRITSSTLQRNVPEVLKPYEYPELPK
ncbi:MAG: SOS response-associated peptidase [Thermoplasmatota archaeon]